MPLISSEATAESEQKGSYDIACFKDAGLGGWERDSAVLLAQRKLPTDDVAAAKALANKVTCSPYHYTYRVYADCCGKPWPNEQHLVEWGHIAHAGLAALEDDAHPLGEEVRVQVAPTTPTTLPANAKNRVVFVSPLAALLRNVQTLKEFHATYSDSWGGNWSIPIYFYLRDLGYEVYLSDRLIDHQLNVVHRYQDDYFASLHEFSGSLLVSLAECSVGECHDMLTASMRSERASIAGYIVQSHGMLEDLLGVKLYVLPLMPQPGLMPRDASRGNRISSAAYMGCLLNCAFELRTPEFAQQMKELGVEFHLNGKDDPRSWKDYRQVDLAIALRPASMWDANNKPPSKLINAWTAGIPLICTPEVSYLSWRKSELDFLVATTSTEVRDCVRMLLEDRSLYDRMCENSRKRAKEFGRRELLRYWVEALQDAGGELVDPAPE